MNHENDMQGRNHKFAKNLLGKPKGSSKRGGGCRGTIALPDFVGIEKKTEA